MEKDLEYTKMAQYYDLLYKNKKYDNEATFIESFLTDKNASILDAGCGTGNHAKILYNKGYDVHGFDLNKEMVDEANKKIKNHFEVGNLLNYKTEKKFDLIISFFAVFNHLKNYKQFKSALKNLKEMLKPNGKIIVDLHNPQKSGKKLDNFGNITRTMEWKVCKVINKEKSKITYLVDNKEYVTTHTFRIFKIKQIEKLNKELGFKNCKFYENYDVKAFATNKSKNIQIVFGT